MINHCPIFKLALHMIIQKVGLKDDPADFKSVIAKDLRSSILGKIVYKRMLRCELFKVGETQLVVLLEASDVDFQ